jgi:hypothetical protein
MSIINRPPEMVKREYELQEPIAVAVEKYATFIQSTPDHVVNSGWPRRAKGDAGMIQRILHARQFLACLLSAATGMALYFRAPFPEDNIFLWVMAIRSASAFLFFKYSFTLFPCTTPYLAYSILLSGIYIFGLKAGRKIRAGKLPPYPAPRKGTELSIVVGEVHHSRKQMPPTCASTQSRGWALASQS